MKLALSGAAFAALLLISNMAAMEPHPQALAAVQKFVQDTRTAADPNHPFDSLVPPATEVIEVLVDQTTARVVFNERIAFRPVDETHIAALRAELIAVLKAAGISSTSVEIALRYNNRPKPNEFPIESHVTSREIIAARAAERSVPRREPVEPLRQRVDHAVPTISAGLAGKYLLVGPSHGWTWHEENRWQLQRARLFTTVEDFYPLSYINPFLIPMLENAGATVFSTRERDWQLAEVIVDSSGSHADSRCVLEGAWEAIPGVGWSGGRPALIKPGENPFASGGAMRAEASTERSAKATYIPAIPRDGRYAVSISWPMGTANSPSVPVIVRHLGGNTTFRVNQQIGGGTWIFLGFFEFAQGTSAEAGSVEISSTGASINLPTADAKAEGEKQAPTYVFADAVRFGGGMGNVAPEDHVSGAPRYAEAAKYFLQYSGAPTIVTEQATSSRHFGIDYWHDILARPEWANYLQGAPGGPNANRNHPGLGIPMDLYLSFHTDAGVDPEGVFGTLSLYRVWDDIGSTSFPDGRSRWLNRDLAALIHQETIRTARGLYTSNWEARALQERDLGEIRRGNVPSMLLELLSHQNFNDMKYGLDPRFRFDQSRAIYKAILRFLAWQDGIDPVVQPLAPIRFAVVQNGDGRATLTWEPQQDPLEPTATPTSYVVYRGRDGKSFDNGTLTTSPRFEAPLEPGELAWFRITAVNDGGESFPTPVLGALHIEGRKPLLVVDGFNRLEGPTIVESATVRGFDRAADPGVGFERNHLLSGEQYDFDPKSEWMNDLESTGWGATDGAWEARQEVGNTFDHAVRHGEMLDQLEIPFDSMVLDAFGANAPLANYVAVDWIAGRQKAVMPPPGIGPYGAPDRMSPAFAVMTDEQIGALESYLAAGGKMLLSGAHAAGELLTGPLATDATRRFTQATLGIDSAVPVRDQQNTLSTAADGSPFAAARTMRFGRDFLAERNLEQLVYPVISAEGYPAEEWVALRHGSAGPSAVARTENTVTLGAPLETILPASARLTVFRAALQELGVVVPP